MADQGADRPSQPEEIAIYRTVADVAPELWTDAEARPQAEMLAGAGVRFEPGRGLIVPFMGGDYEVDLPGRTVTGPPGHLPAAFQKGLVLLTYLTRAQDLGLSGRMVTGRELNGGAMFFTGPHTFLTAPVTEKFGSEPEAFLRRAAALGFVAEDGGSGFVCCRGVVLPHIAVACILHPGDEEFPAELTYLFDSYAQYHLPLDGLWALINVLAEELAA